MVDDADLKEAFKRAAEIAKAVPVQFQQAAFNRALDSLQGTTGATGRTRGRWRAARAAGMKPRVEKSTGGTVKGKTGRQKRGSGRPGPKAALLELKAKGFFGTKRTITDVRDHLEKKRGHKFSLQDLSPGLLSLVRDVELDRDKNAQGQYEYKAV
jgi:hypothetical protein